MFVIGGDSEQVAAAGAAETMDPTNPIHIICDTCGSGMNEKCVTKSGTKLKNFHVARTRTARQYSNAKQYGADAAKAQQDRRTQEQPSA